MSIMETLVTDRARTDVDRAAELSAKGLHGMTAAEKSEYLAGLRGAYNTADLNRVQEAAAYVAERLRGYGISVALGSAKTWTMTDIPSPTEMETYLLNIRTLRGAVSIFGQAPAVPSDMEGLTWQEANDIERILLAVDRTLDQMARSFVRCGSAGLYCGHAGLPTEEAYAPHTWAELDAQGWTWADWDQKNWIQLNYWR